jgi:hypothetical protein
MDNIFLKLICQEKIRKIITKLRILIGGWPLISAITSKYQLLDFSVISQYNITKFQWLNKLLFKLCYIFGYIY